MNEARTFQEATYQIKTDSFERALRLHHPAVQTSRDERQIFAQVGHRLVGHLLDVLVEELEAYLTADKLRLSGVDEFPDWVWTLEKDIITLMAARALSRKPKVEANIQQLQASRPSGFDPDAIEKGYAMTLAAYNALIAYNANYGPNSVHNGPRNAFGNHDFQY